MTTDTVDTIEQRLTSGAPIAPIALHLAARSVELMDLGGVACREPFFFQTIERLEALNVLRASIDVDRFARAVPAGRPAPDGCIFHTGRCGSTLLANMLEGAGRNAVLREPRTLIDLTLAWLEADAHESRREVESLLSLLLPQMLWAAGADARYRLIKPAAWNVQLADPLLRVFPATPAVFVFRSPLETVASMLFDPPYWLEWIDRPRSVHARYLPSLATEPADAPLSETTFFSHAWRSAAEAALALPRERVLFLDYADLVANPASVLERVLAHFRMAVDGETTTSMLAASSTYSKDPGRSARFDPKGAHRRPSLTADEIAAVERVAGESWEQMRARAQSM